MSSSIVVIAAGERSTEAVLAAEALRRAATAAGRSVTIEIRSDQGVLGALPTELTNGAAHVLIVGDADADTARFGDAQLLHLSLGAVLDDPAAAVSQLAATTAPASTSATTDASGAGGKRIVAITSCPTGIAHTFMAAGPAAGRKEARLPDARGNAGVGGRAGRIDRRGNPRGRRGHHRCRPRSGPGPFRWQATVQERHQAGDQRWPGAHPESPGRGRRARWRSSGCGRQRHIGRQGQCAHRRLQAPDDRCVVHAALRHRWRPVDRAGLRARRHLCRRRRAPGHAGLVAVPDRRQGRFPP